MPTFLDIHSCAHPPHLHGTSLFPALEGVRVREDAIFGYFAMALTITDGRYVYFRHPVNADLGPLFAYTAMPVAGLNSFFPREVYDRIEMGRYFGHTYNLPLYRIPVPGGVPGRFPGRRALSGVTSFSM